MLSMNDTPLVSTRAICVFGHLERIVGTVANSYAQGFGVSARSTAEARRLDPTGVTTFRQGDIGEYLREEDTLFTT